MTESETTVWIAVVTSFMVLATALFIFMLYKLKTNFNSANSHQIGRIASISGVGV